MNLNRLETFLTLADCLNFTEASERLYCSQPSVSMQIQSLEKELNTRLFDRIGKSIYLTKQGEHFKPYALQILNTFKAAKEHLHQLEDLSAGTLSFGASNFVGVYLLPMLLARFKKQFPKIHISMEIKSSRQLMGLLEANSIEFLILSDQIDFDKKQFHMTSFYRDKLVLVAAPNHRLAKEKVCGLQDLQEETFLTKPKNSATRDFLFQKLGERGVTLTNLMEISSLEGIKQAVIHELGISIISRFAVAHEIASGLLVELEIEDITFERGIRYIYHKGKFLSPAAKNFLQLLDNGFSGLDPL